MRPSPEELSRRFPGVQIHESAWIDLPCEIGAGTVIWHFGHVMADSRIGQDCALGQNVVVAPGVTLGNRVRVQNNVSLYSGVELDDCVFCGPSVVFTNVLTPRVELPRQDEFRATPVRRGATLGANSTVVCGHEIGRYALVGAGAVITSDVPDYALMLGLPARRAGWACRCGLVLPKEDPANEIHCSGCGNRYRAQGERLDALEEHQGLEDAP